MTFVLQAMPAAFWRRSAGDVHPSPALGPSCQPMSTPHSHEGRCCQGSRLSALGQLTAAQKPCEATGLVLRLGCKTKARSSAHGRSAQASQHIVCLQLPQPGLLPSTTGCWKARGQVQPGFLWTMCFAKSAKCTPGQASLCQPLEPALPACPPLSCQRPSPAKRSPHAGLCRSYLW